MTNEPQIRRRVHDAYSAAADRPEGSHAFPVGRQFAESLGYPAELLAQLPVASVDAFAGVSNVSVFADIPEGATVLDLGCGAGLDSLIAARRTGSHGAVMGVDFSEAMVARARASAAEAETRNLLFCRADAENLPVRTESIDVALVNGIFNLNPAREAVFLELGRVVRSGGAVYSAELILSKPLPPEEQRNESNWFA
ncbi:MAG TPA: methyltransferase domain-containing protein [Terriglobia bacterium]|nr:methyltransferase domain-containing protein [Terriglobia bacterium]